MVFFEHLLPAGWWNIAASRTDPSPCLRELVVWDTGGALSGEVRRPRVQRMITDAVEKTAGRGWLLGPKEVLGRMDLGKGAGAGAARWLGTE